MSAGLRRAAPRVALMEGRLKDHPLAELIQEISDANLSGALRLSFDRVKAVVYFDAGRVAAAASNLRALRITEILLRGGALDASTLFSVVGEGGASDEEACEALRRAGALEEAALSKARERQTTEVLRDALRRPEGDWNFQPRVRLAGGAPRAACVNVTQLLVEGARELAAEFVAKRMWDDGETLVPAHDAFRTVEAGRVQLSPTEGFVLSRVYEPTNLRYVLAVSGLPEDETRRAVYALTLGGLIERERKPRALPADVKRLAAERPQAAAAHEQPQPDAAATHEPEPQETPAAAAAPDAAEDPRVLIEELLALARGESHYGVLGVMRSASPADVKRAYYALARRLHPDRLRRAAETEERQRIDAAFAKIAQAYEVLKDSSLRAAYDLKLEKLRASAPRAAQPDAEQSRADAPRADAPRTGQATRAEADADAPRAGRATDASASSSPSAAARAESAASDEAEQKFRRGAAAYAKNDFAGARLLFSEAAHMVPTRARYRAHLGRALAREKSTRRQAESELLAAIALDGLDPSFRVMLAELYRDVGLRRKAEAQLERALALDPSNADARALLKELRRDA